ncbi:DDE 3 domain-containing protein [Aphis craccivora]|uniref:DDE 3 domain-containing protein n=1 Tax=Aphis craccivora TaxID=307492 RepID=A0A6G0YWU2_APHCR|nr:DDE 3 domain-containing protein [Aphis craccivora]
MLAGSVVTLAAHDTRLFKLTKPFNPGTTGRAKVGQFDNARSDVRNGRSLSRRKIITPDDDCSLPLVALIHDNVFPHTAAKTKEEIQDLHWKLILTTHLDDSADNVLKRRGTQDYTVVDRFNSRAVYKLLYAEKLMELMQRYDKCSKVNGVVVEK